MTSLIEADTENTPRKKTDWAALRRQNEAEFQAGLDRVAAAYIEQREAPWKQLQEDFKTEASGRAAMQMICRQLITHGALEAHAKHLASLVTISPMRRQFNEVSYQVPAAASAAFATQSANDASVSDHPLTTKLLVGPVPY